MALKGERECVEDVAALFAQRGEVGADDAEGLGAGDGTETPGGLLFELGHADIAFGLVVVEGHARVAELGSCQGMLGEFGRVGFGLGPAQKVDHLARPGRACRARHTR